MMRRVLLALLAIGCVAAEAETETLSGRVLEVIDGDTVRIELAGRAAAIVRLAWIDAPDRLQDHGEAARTALNALLAGRAVRIETVGNGGGPQLRAAVWVAPKEVPCSGDDCPKTLDVAHALLAQGHAWHDRRRLGQPMTSSGQYEQAEFEAKVRRRGLWAAKNPVPPWDWRPRLNEGR